MAVRECVIFLSSSFPYQATSPDGIISLDDTSFGLIEVKCPFKHQKALSKKLVVMHLFVWPTLIVELYLRGLMTTTTKLLVS